MDIAGWRIFYGDGTIVSSPSDWLLSKSDNVQMVTVYYDHSYKTYMMDSYDEKGNPVNPRWETLDYCQQMIGQDYYWFNPLTKTYGAGSALEIPKGLPDGAVKVGQLMVDADWWPLYNAAKEVRTL